MHRDFNFGGCSFTPGKHSGCNLVIVLDLFHLSGHNSASFPEGGYYTPIGKDNLADFDLQVPEPFTASISVEDIYLSDSF